MRVTSVGLAFLALSTLACKTEREPATKTAVQSPVINSNSDGDRTAHAVRAVAVESGIKLETLDCGGQGPPGVLVTGHGNTAHVYDEFALRRTDRSHVYGIARRGGGRRHETWRPNQRPCSDALNTL